MNTEDFVNLLDDLRCELQILNANFERWFRVIDPTDVTKESEPF